MRIHSYYSWYSVQLTIISQSPHRMVVELWLELLLGNRIRRPVSDFWAPIRVCVLLWTRPTKHTHTLNGLASIILSDAARHRQTSQHSAARNLMTTCVCVCECVWVCADMYATRIVLAGDWGLRQQNGTFQHEFTHNLCDVVVDVVSECVPCWIQLAGQDFSHNLTGRDILFHHILCGVITCYWTAKLWRADRLGCGRVPRDD